jgi:hypothetical protein
LDFASSMASLENLPLSILYSAINILMVVFWFGKIMILKTSKDFGYKKTAGH